MHVTTVRHLIPGTYRCSQQRTQASCNKVATNLRMNPSAFPIQTVAYSWTSYYAVA